MSGLLKLAEVKLHPHYCDCGGCWTGITACRPKPQSWFRRLLSQLRALASLQARGEQA